MFEKDENIYYLDEEFNIKGVIYKGEIYSLPYKDICHIDSYEDGNIIINSDMIFKTRAEALRVKSIM